MTDYINSLAYCRHEMVSVYGATIKEAIQEEFDDGIMSAIDFSMESCGSPIPRGIESM